jgi:hypothetical protein
MVPNPIPIEATPTATPLFLTNHLPTEELPTTTPIPEAPRPHNTPYERYNCNGVCTKLISKNPMAVTIEPMVIIHFGAILSRSHPEKMPPIAYMKKLMDAASEIVDMGHWYSENMGVTKTPKQYFEP